MGLFGKKKTAPVDEPEVTEIDDELDAEGSAAVRYDRTAAGPWDESERASEDLLDLGGLRVAGFEGMELRLELDQETGDVVGLTAIDGDSQMQVHPYAAPRTTGVWNEIRMEIAENVRANGGQADVDEGELGTHLDVHLPQELPGGGTALVPMRFYGVDGPRWFVRGLLMGAAVTDEEARARLVDWFRQTVVVRGQQPMSPRTPLPMHLPEGAVPEPGQGVVPPISDHGPAENVEDLHPFERGPEIREIR